MYFRPAHSHSVAPAGIFFEALYSSASWPYSVIVVISYMPLSCTTVSRSLSLRYHLS